MKLGRKDISRLSVGKSGLPDGDPNAIRDNCCACGEWTENLNPKTRRCNREECKRKLAQRALDIGCAVKVGNTIIGNLDSAVSYMPKYAPNVMVGGVVHKVKDLCSVCGNNVKRPNDDRCVRCRLKTNTQKRKMRHKR